MFFFGLFIGSVVTAYSFTYSRVNPAIIAFVTDIKAKFTKPKA